VEEEQSDCSVDDNKAKPESMLNFTEALHVLVHESILYADYITKRDQANIVNS
jgi:hypothetical protein